MQGLGVGTVWAAQFGGKVPLDEWKAAFPAVLNLCICGLEKGRAGLELFGRVPSYIHPLWDVGCGKPMT